MADVFSKAKRSWLMGRVRGKDTLPERRVRSFLHRHGFRFRLHESSLPGKPDVVLPKHRTVVFVNGCFWHGHNCKDGRRPRSNQLPGRESVLWSNHRAGEWCLACSSKRTKASSRSGG